MDVLEILGLEDGRNLRPKSDLHRELHEVHAGSFHGTVGRRETDWAPGSRTTQSSPEARDCSAAPIAQDALRMADGGGF
jgi:hypothetical protein